MEVAVQEVDNILVLTVLHNQNLIDDQILLGLQVQVHLLNSNTLVGVVLVGSKNTTRRTLADFVEVVVQPSRVPGRTDGKKSRPDVHRITLARSLSGASCRSGACSLVHRGDMLWWALDRSLLRFLASRRLLTLTAATVELDSSNRLLSRGHGLLLLLLVLSRRRHIVGRPWYGRTISSGVRPAQLRLRFRLQGLRFWDGRRVELRRRIGLLRWTCGRSTV